MPRRVKKPLVKPELRRQWFRRFEEDGESAAQIAKSDEYDVRTVRKQIELSRQEREAREARSVVLRHALEEHYKDLLKFSENLLSALTTDSPVPLPQRHDPMWSALREHMPRSPIWKGIDRWEHLRTELTKLQEQGAARLLEEFESNTRLQLASGFDEPGVWLNNLRDAVGHRMRLLAGGGSPELFAFSTTATPEGWKVIHYGAWYCGTVPPEQEGEVKELITGLMNQAGNSPECISMEQKISELRKVESNMSQELTTIRLRRVVPGRCRYCPI